MLKINKIQSGSGGNAYLISDPQTTILLEAGADYSKISKNVESKIDACLVSHSHNDHTKSISDIEALRIPIYTHFDVANNKNLIRYNEVQPQKTYTIKTFKVVPFELVHDVYILGYLLYSTITKERLLFITDTMYVKNRFKDNIDYLLIECNHTVDKLLANKKYPDYVKKRIRQTHLNLDDVVNFLNTNNLTKLKELHPIHMSKANSNIKLVRETLEKITKAKVIM